MMKKIFSKIAYLIKSNTTGFPFILFFVAGAAISFLFLFFEYIKHLEHIHFERVVYVLLLSAVWFVSGDIFKKRKIFPQPIHFIIDSIFWLLTFGFIVYYTGGMHGDFSFILFLAAIGAAIYGTNFQTLIFLLILSAESYFICVLANEGVNIYHLGITTLYAVFYFIIAGLIKYFYIITKKSREEYVELIETAPLCIKVFDKNMKMVFLNKGGREEHRIKDTDDISKWDWVGTVKEKYQAEAKEKFQNAFTKGESSTLEFEHTPEGSTHEWCSSLISPIKDKDGKVKSVLFLSSDITERKKIEERLLKKQKEQELILDSTSSWIFFKDTENRFIRVNKSFAEAMKMPKEKLEGASLFDIYPKEQAEAFWADDKAVIASGKPKLNIIEPMNSPKGILWVQTDKIPYRDEGGKIVGIIGFTTDITSKKLIEEERRKNLEKTEETKIALFNILEDVKESELNLKEERDRVKAIVSSMGEGLLLVDKDFKIVLINQMASALIRMAPVAARGKNLAEVFHLIKENQEFLALNEIMEKTFKQGGNVKNFGLEDKIFCRNSAGWDFPIALTISPFLGDGITGAIIVFRDITKEKDLDEAKNSFISIASHQLRTPLTSIRWYAEMLDSEDVGPLNKDQKDFVARVYSGALRLNEVINLLLALARIESEKTEIELVKLNLSSLTEDILKELDPQIKQKNLEVELLLEKQLPEINFDATMLRQVVTNLLSNSIRYTDKGGRIEIRVEKKENEIIYSVKDNGIGIPESQQDKIFNKFFRAANAVSKVPDGSGLGLSLVKALTELWGGKVWFESQEGKATTFYFTIPLTNGNQQIVTNNK